MNKMTKKLSFQKLALYLNILIFFINRVDTALFSSLNGTKEFSWLTIVLCHMESTRDTGKTTNIGQDMLCLLFCFVYFAYGCIHP
jgi:hypothetical protein